MKQLQSSNLTGFMQNKSECYENLVEKNCHLTRLKSKLNRNVMRLKSK